MANTAVVCAAEPVSLFDQVLRARDIVAQFQPIVRLDDLETVGFEALARGPSGSPLESPLELFALARRLGRTPELSWVCQAMAVKAYLAAEPDPALALFVNVEPSSLGHPCPDDLAPIFDTAGGVPVILELTERAVA